MEDRHELIAVFFGEKWAIQHHFRNPRQGPEYNVFYAWLGCGRHGDGVPIASEPRCDPQNVEITDGALRSVQSSVCQQDLLLRIGQTGHFKAHGQILAGPHLLAESSNGQAKEPETAPERKGQTLARIQQSTDFRLPFELNPHPNIRNRTGGINHDENNGDAYECGRLSGSNDV